MSEAQDSMWHPAHGGTVCIVGNLNIDLIIRGVRRLPEWGREVSGSSHITVSSGQAGYLALALAHLGVPVVVIGKVGSDDFGRQILDDLWASGVDIGAVEVIRGGATGITVAISRHDGERAFVSDFACLRDFDESLVLRHWDRIDAAQIVCLVGLFCLPGLTLDAAARLMAKARAQGKTTMLDTGWDPRNWPADTVLQVQDLLRQVTIFMPNLDEARIITGANTVEEAAAALQEQGPDPVVIKCGAQGSFARHGSKVYALPALSTEVYDTVGAGDVFDAGFLSGFRLGWSVQACLAFGNAAASLYISRPSKRYPEATAVAAAAAPYGVIPIGQATE